MPAQQVLRIFLLLSGKTDNVVKDGLKALGYVIIGLSARIVYRQAPLVNIAIKH